MIVLVLGGARSGKSAVAERIATKAAGDDAVTYVATMWDRGDDTDDPDLTHRLDAHRRRRPHHWTTVEPPYDMGDVLASVTGTVLVDSLGPWVAAQPEMSVDSVPLLGALQRRLGTTVLVSDEVGWGVHPETELGRRFRDALGTLNQALAAVADDALLVVAGRVLRLDQL